jgi:hypothetical protein
MARSGPGLPSSPTTHPSLIFYYTRFLRCLVLYTSRQWDYVARMEIHRIKGLLTLVRSATPSWLRHSRTISLTRPGRSGRVFAVGDDIAAPLLRLQVVRLHQTAELLAVYHHALIAQSRTHPPVAVALEPVTGCLDPDQNLIGSHGDRWGIIEGGTRQPYQFASSADRETTGPVMTEAFVLLSRGACFKAPLSISISSARDRVAWRWIPKCFDVMPPTPIVALVSVDRRLNLDPQIMALAYCHPVRPHSAINRRWRSRCAGRRTRHRACLRRHNDGGIWITLVDRLADLALIEGAVSGEGGNGVGELAT